ncbi:hypothetical protein [Acetobacter persici]|uniref:hypothetical protein n=1 Tax=Acetobacter persici TaxID=1076596 RepID=UPI001F245B66|nr:hypothetical protein [Acetobacter persici]MCG0998225.1 hypothetical protein [Acetobacter persici]
MTTTILFLAWQDKTSRRWYPVGKLEANVEQSYYKFVYISGALSAQKEAKFLPLADFPELFKKYESSELFPLFKNRVLSRGRPDFPEYLRQLDLNSSATAPEILAAGGGDRATDTLEVFPKLNKNENGHFCCKFFLHGWRYVNESAQKKLSSLQEGEELRLSLELTNPVTRIALQIHTPDYYMIGWTPRYLVDDILGSLKKSAVDEYKLKILRINYPPAPTKQRYLIEMVGTWPEHEPMSQGFFEPII